MTKHPLEWVRALEVENAQLRQALVSRIHIEQAKGVLSAHTTITPDEAFDVMRRAARSQNRNLHELARKLIELRAAPSKLLAELGRRDGRAEA
jgi:AmiR/NasT family two-component response regulator